MKNALRIILLLSVSVNCFGMATEDFGPDKDRDHPTHAQPGWQKRIVEVPKHSSRVYSMWCNGGEYFYFNADIEQINELIDLFSKVCIRDHQINVENKKWKVKSYDGNKIDCNVMLEMTGGLILALQQSENKAVTYEPVLTINVDKSSDVINKLKLPENIILNNGIEDIAVQSKQQIPERRLWYGTMRFKDGDWTDGYVKGYITIITLWKKGVKDGVVVSKVDSLGDFRIAFSDAEIEQLKTGETWLTVTIGNWLTEAKSDDSQIDLEMLSTDKSELQAVELSQPGFYYGRILFDDGSPHLGPSPWSGAEMLVDFSYAGSIRIDHDGYFQVYFTDEQFNKLITMEPRKNILIPSWTMKNESTARGTFPVSLLSKDRANAGVVTLTRPDDFENLKNHNTVNADSLLTKLRANDKHFDSLLLKYTKTYIKTVKPDPFHFIKFGDDPSRMPKDYWDARKYRIVDTCQLIVRGDEGVLIKQCNPLPMDKYKYEDITRQFGKTGLVDGLVYELHDMQLEEDDPGKNTPNYEKQLTIRNSIGPCDGIHNVRRDIEFAFGVGYGKRIKEITEIKKKGSVLIVKGTMRLWTDDLSTFEIEVNNSGLVRKAIIQGNCERFEISSNGSYQLGDLSLAVSGTFKRTNSAYETNHYKHIQDDFKVKYAFGQSDLSDQRYKKYTQFNIEPLMQVNDRVRGIKGTGPDYDKF